MAPRLFLLSFSVLLIVAFAFAPTMAGETGGENSSGSGANGNGTAPASGRDGDGNYKPQPTRRPPASGSGSAGNYNPQPTRRPPASRSGIPGNTGPAPTSGSGDTGNTGTAGGADASPTVAPKPHSGSRSGIPGNTGPAPTSGSGDTGNTGTAGGADASPTVAPKPHRTPHSGEGRERCFGVFIKIKKYCFDYAKLLFLEPYFAKRACCKSILAFPKDCGGGVADGRDSNDEEGDEDEKGVHEQQHGEERDDKYNEFYGMMVKNFCEGIDDDKCDCE